MIIGNIFSSISKEWFIVSTFRRVRKNNNSPFLSNWERLYVANDHKGGTMILGLNTNIRGYRDQPHLCWIIRTNIKLIQSSISFEELTSLKSFKIWDFVEIFEVPVVWDSFILYIYLLYLQANSCSPMFIFPKSENHRLILIANYVWK